MEGNNMQKSKLLRKEMFTVKCPKKIAIGDPCYFDTMPPSRLKELVADYTLPKFFKARLYMYEYELPAIQGYRYSAIQLYMAPKETIEVYAEGMKYKSQMVECKEIGVDTAEYVIEVDDRYESISTMADGYWGDVYEYQHPMENGKTSIAGILIDMAMPDYMTYEEVKKVMDYLFEDMQPIEENAIPKKSEKNKSLER